MRYMATTKFLTACESSVEFKDQESAISYLDKTYESIVCFYNGLNGLGSGRKIEKQTILTVQGNYAFRVMAEKVDLRGKVNMVFLAVFSVKEVVDGPPYGTMDKYTVDNVDN